MRVFFYTLGCKSNQYETGQIAEKFLALGFTPVSRPDGAEIIVVNTCSITHIAERKARNIIRKFLKQNPKLYVCGCYANTTDLTKIIPEAILIKQNIKLQPELWGLPQPRIVPDTNKIIYRVREFLKIQEGCDRFCSYCIVPYARPEIYSESPEQILRTAKKFLQNGVKEIVLTGINLGLYQYENTTLADILRLLLQTEIPRIRISSLEPDLVTPEILEIIAAEPRIARHLHIPLQSGSDNILHAMRRRYTVVDFRKLIASVRKTLGENIGLMTDIIVGFPGETEQTFQETFDFLTEIGFSDLHIFPYSPRPQTTATGFTQTCSDKTQRIFIEKLETLRQKQKLNFLQKQKNLTVLAENERGGFSSEYAQVRFIKKVTSGNFYTASPVEIQDEIILAEPAPR